MNPRCASAAPTDRQLRKHVAWLDTLSPDALITLAAMHFRLAAEKSKRASVVLAVELSRSNPEKAL